MKLNPSLTHFFLWINLPKLTERGILGTSYLISIYHTYSFMFFCCEGNNSVLLFRGLHEDN